MWVKCEPWVINPYVIFPSVYVRRCLLNKETFHLWDYPANIWIHMNKENLGLLWEDLSSYHPGRILQVILEAVLKSKSESGLVQETT